jgi:hypothetical protein
MTGRHELRTGPSWHKRRKGGRGAEARLDARIDALFDIMSDACRAAGLPAPAETARPRLRAVGGKRD